MRSEVLTGILLSFFLSFEIIVLTYITLFFKYLVIRKNDHTNQKTYLYFYVFSKGLDLEK